MKNKHHISAALTLFFTCIASIPTAQSADVDWKYYGGTKTAVCFFEANGIEHSKIGNIRVWAKCLSKSDLESVDAESDADGKILNASASKIGTYYMPPIDRVEPLNEDQKITITIYEVTANIAFFEPQASIFYELNCKERLVRELSISVVSAGRKGERRKPTDWWHVPPEGNISALQKLLCTKS